MAGNEILFAEVMTVGKSWQELRLTVEMMFSLHRQLIFMLFLIPVLYTLLFGGLFYQNSLTKVPVTICNLDSGENSRELLEDLLASPDLQVVAVTTDAAVDAEQLMASSGAAGVIVIPHDYTVKTSNGTCANVELIASYGNTVEGGTITKAVQAVVSSKNAELVTKSRLAAGWSGVQAKGAQMLVSFRTLYNPTGGYTDFFLAALIVHGGQIAMVFLLGPAFVLEKRFRGREMLKNPVRVLGVKLLLYSVLGTTVMSLCLSISMAGFGLVCRGDGGDILVLLLAYMVCMVAFALFVGAWVNVPYRAITYPLFYIMPSVLFSGAIWPRSSMDSASLLFSYLLPIGYTANDLRNLLVKGVDAGLELHIGILLLWGILFFGLAVWGLNHTKEGKKNAGHYVAGMETIGS